MIAKSETHASETHASDNSARVLGATPETPPRLRIPVIDVDGARIFGDACAFVEADADERTGGGSSVGRNRKKICSSV